MAGRLIAVRDLIAMVESQGGPEDLLVALRCLPADSIVELEMTHKITGAEPFSGVGEEELREMLDPARVVH